MNEDIRRAPTPAQEEDAAALLRSELTEGLQTTIGLHRQFAEQWAEQLTAFLRGRIGNQRIWIPGLDRAARDAAIYREFNGQNGAEVCGRYGVSRSRMYQIIEEQRALVQAESPVLRFKTGQGGA